MVGFVNGNRDVYVLRRRVRPVLPVHYKGQLSLNSTENQWFAILLTPLRDNLLFDIL